MTRRHTRTEPEAEPPRDPLALALALHQAQFGDGVTFAGIAAARAGEVTALLLEAIRNGQPTSDREIRLALGMTALPPGVDASPLSVAIERYRGRFGDAPWSIGTPTSQLAGRPAAIRRRKALAAGAAEHARDPWPAENYEVLNWAVRVYGARFGRGPSVHQFLRWPIALAREIQAAVQREEKLTGEDLHHRLGMTPPPVDVET